jgi:hypothetical protein
MRDIPKEASIPFSEAYIMTSGDVLKNATAMNAVTIHPMILIRVPDSRRKISPVKITRMGIIARIKS